MRTDTQTLAESLDVLAREIQSGDGVANAAIAEAAERLRELEKVADDACAYFVAKNRASMGRTLAFMADTNPHFKQAVDAYLRGKEGPDA